MAAVVGVSNNFAVGNEWRLNFNAWLYLVEDAYRLRYT